MRHRSSWPIWWSPRSLCILRFGAIRSWKRYNPDLRPKIPAALLALCIAAYFFFLAGPSLRADFTYDDLGNLYFSWIKPLPEWLKANVLFFLPPSRPLGRLFYALGFRFAGLD